MDGGRHVVERLQSLADDIDGTYNGKSEPPQGEDNEGIPEEFGESLVFAYVRPYLDLAFRIFEKVFGKADAFQ